MHKESKSEKPVRTSGHKESKSEKPVRASGHENEGEGNKTAARHYNEATQKYVASGKVDDAAREAQEALDGPEGEELRRAEQEGKRPAAAGAKPGKK